MKALFKFLKIQNKNDFKQFLSQILKFGIVGVLNTTINLCIYYLLTWLGMYYLIANVVGFLASVLNAYFLNKRFVFKETTTEKNKATPFIKVFVSYSGTFLLGTVLLVLMVDVLGISQFLAPIINLCITIPINFLLNKFWAFK